MAQVVSTMVYEIDGARPGAFVLIQDRRANIIGMIVACPCGCGDSFPIAFSDDGDMDWNRRPSAITLTSGVQACVPGADGEPVPHYSGALVSGIWHEVN